MATRWSKLVGDKDVFAFEAAFEPDPYDGRAVTPDDALSWGGFQIWVGGRNLCAHRELGVTLESVHWHLLPLMEWLAACWDPLLHEERLPIATAGDDAWDSLHETRFPPAAVGNDERQASPWYSAWQEWRARHALQTAAEGGLYPDIVFRRYRDLVEISWGPARTVGMPSHYRFLESGRGVERLPPKAVAEPLYEALSDAAGYLQSLAPESSRIRKLNRNFAALKEARDASERRLEWLAGVRTDTRTERREWIAAWTYLSNSAENGAAPLRSFLEISESPLVIDRSCRAAQIFGLFAPRTNAEDIVEIAETMAKFHSPKGDSPALGEICRPCQIGGAPAASEHGYDLAEELHEHYDGKFHRGDCVDIEGMLALLDIGVAELRLRDRAIRGVAIAGPRHRPAIGVNANHPANARECGRRFTLAHELCHLLFDRGEEGRLAIASGPWAPRGMERRADAFAAMLLMPWPAVQRAAAQSKASIDTAEGVRGLAQWLRVGAPAALSHLTNIALIDDDARRRIEDGLWRQAH